MNLTVNQSENVLDKKYYSQIDGLRFISIFCVLIQHYITPKISHYFLTGKAGVDLFFVISGFLITENLIKLRNRNNFRRGIEIFYIRRVLRIFPLYYLYWIILFIFFFQLIDAYKYYGLFYLLNFYDIYHDLVPVTGHLWSLSVEEQFYIIWPFVIFLTPGNKLKYIVVATIIGSLLFALINYSHEIQVYNYFHTFSCSVALLTGAIIAVLKQENIPLLKKLIKIAGYLAPLMLLSILLVSILKKLNYLEERDTYFIRIFMSVIGLYAVGTTSVDSFKGRFGHFLENIFVRKIGQMAYGIYIFHYLTYTILDPYFKQIHEHYFTGYDDGNIILKLMRYNPTLVFFPFHIIAALLIAWVSYTYFETKILQFKKYFE